MEHDRRGLLRFWRDVAVTYLLLLALAGLIWWLGGWRTLLDLSTILIGVGAGAMGLGVLSHQGSLGIASDPLYHYIETTGLNDRHKRIRRHSSDIQQAFSFMVIMLTAGFLSVLLGWLVQMLVT
jgi:hypothetical protein